MVYRQTQQGLRHNAWPLRLSPAATAQVVGKRGVRCSHFDAFRFFTLRGPPAQCPYADPDPLAKLDQPGLHVSMDLYNDKAGAYPTSSESRCLHLWE
ncbi:MAG TPA: hypothetical protein DGT23_26995 [Micromonosporaceae bacterium]|nr:hypothetical protein [Micromonosporaceae bacterium]